MRELTKFTLQSTVLRAANQTSTIRAAYLYYYATESAFPPNEKPPSNPSAAEETALQTQLQTRLRALLHDLLILAKQADMHVVNAVTILDNPLFLRDQKFEPGDGKLHFYLFNWRTKALGGGIDGRGDVDASKMGGVGVVML